MLRGVALIPLLLLSLTPVLEPQQDLLRQRLDAATYAALRSVLEEATRDSLPVRALEAKALEGVAKNRPGPQILGAVTRLANDYRQVRATLATAAQAAPEEREVVAAAEARNQGAPLEHIGALKRGAPPGTSLEIPYALLGALVGRGVPADYSLSVIQHLVSSGVPQDRMVQIPQRIDVGLGLGAPPTAALGSALQTLGIPTVPAAPGPPGQLPRVPGY